jgi:catechol 2,3-dioxygenase-like lactoylglutathione lyase family enzyme
MTDATTTGLIQISLVCIVTPDQDRALEFYVDRLGFEKRTDIEFGGRYRWIEVYPPSGSTGIALAPPPEGAPAVGGVNTGITITTDDIDASHAALRDAGVDVDAEVSRMGGPVPPMFWLRDPDANVLLVVENPSA